MTLVTLSATAQNDQLKIQLGVKGGVQVTEMSFSGDVLKNNNRAGFFVGPVLKFKTPVVGLGVDVKTGLGSNSNGPNNKFVERGWKN